MLSVCCDTKPFTICFHIVIRVNLTARVLIDWRIRLANSILLKTSDYTG